MATGGDGIFQRCRVGIGGAGAAGDAKADACDMDVRMGGKECALDVVAGGLALNVVGKCKNDFLNIFPRVWRDSFFQGGEVELGWPDALNGREFAVQDVVTPIVGTGALKGHQIGDLFDDAEMVVPTARVGAQAAEGVFGEVTATLATTQTLGGVEQGVEQRLEPLRVFNEQVQGEPFRRTVSQSGQLLEQLADMLECIQA